MRATRSESTGLKVYAGRVCRNKLPQIWHAKIHRSWTRETPQIGPAQLGFQRPQCRLRVKSGSPAWTSECPMLGVKRKSISGRWMSVPSQTRTFRESRFKAQDSSSYDRTEAITGRSDTFSRGRARHRAAQLWSEPVHAPSRGLPRKSVPKLSRWAFILCF